ncbi:hypothetical protein BDV98DRAFT_316 [Pterulicium gracile]|uniref:Uncharacterized protein n=1 Tax=Pterulicium gracile TaxID=1884261 RepID=A0A5C3QXU8_9AGAR|nr:hypothetical protein BDV98DRAFT_316 [Pterula gracilis]
MFSKLFHYTAEGSLSLPVMSVSFEGGMARLILKPQTMQGLELLVRDMFGVNRARSLLFYIPAAFFQLGEDTALTTEVYPIVKDRLVRVAAAYTGHESAPCSTPNFFEHWYSDSSITSMPQAKASGLCTRDSPHPDSPISQSSYADAPSRSSSSHLALGQTKGGPSRNFAEDSEDELDDWGSDLTVSDDYEDPAEHAAHAHSMFTSEHSNGSQIKRPATFRQDTARPTRPSVNIPVPVPPKGALNVASAEQTSIVDVGPVPLLRIRSASPPLEQLNAPRARRDSGVHWLEEAAADTQMQFFTPCSSSSYEALFDVTLQLALHLSLRHPVTYVSPDRCLACGVFPFGTTTH